MFFFTEELMQELEGSDTPRSVHLRKNDVIVIRHRRVPKPNDLVVRLDLRGGCIIVHAYPKARCAVRGRAHGAPPPRAPGRRHGARDEALRTVAIPARSTAAARRRRPSPWNEHPDLVQILKLHEFKRQMAAH